MQTKELEDECRAIYDEASHLVDSNGDVVRHGLNILYGPPIFRPSVFIATLQGAGAQPTVQKHWPTRLLFDDESKDGGNRFGDNLRAAMLRTNTRYLLERAMASCVVFPQAPQSEAAAWKRKHLSGSYDVWRSFSVRMCKRLIELTEPSMILTFGEKPFEWINQGVGQEFRRQGQSKIIKRYGQYNGVKIIGSAHLSQGVRNEEIDAILLEIRQTVHQ